ncbi:MAG: hypothetical protein ACTS6O_01125 [Giesbergeria sp.]
MDCARLNIVSFFQEINFMDMSPSRRRWMFRFCAPVVLALAATGCATGTGSTSGASQSQGDSSKAALLKRSQAYWDAVQKNDRVTAWSFEEVSKDPNWTLEAYLKRGGIVFDAVEVRDVKSIEGDKALVDVWVRYSIPLLRMKTREGIAPDEWRLIDGVWSHVLKNSSMPSS